MRETRAVQWLAWVGLFALVLSGCQGEDADGYVAGETEFVSATPTSGGRESGPDAGNGAPGEDDGQDGGGEERTIEEADVVKLDGSRLYVLNAYRGLQIIDVANPDTPALLGMAGVYGHPVEMYVRGTRAYVVVSNYYDYWVAEDAVAAEGDAAYATPYRGSRIVVVDVANARDPQVLGSYDVPGEVTDTRIVGDVLYAVSNRYAWYWGYETDDNEDGTWVMSLSIADPADIHEVDRQVFPRANGWDNHVHVTTEAIYVATPGYDWDGQTGGAVTRLQYVDISDPAGDLALGGEASVTGYVFDRWMLDEYQGVLRVVSSPDWNLRDPEVTTFQVGEGGTLTRLASINVVPPEPEQVTAVRFDGPLVYVVTYRRIDPLFIVDLTDPAAPVARGELGDMDGWIDHIVPRGDRLVALGHAETSTGGFNLAVALFDVSNPDAPTRIDRVSFGGDWGWLPDERDNFDKVFKVLDELGLVLVPFYSYGFDEGTGYWQHVGGVQLVDFARDDLTLRGLVQHGGFAKRALPHQDRLLTISDERMQTVDITDRDQPQVVAEVELARNVVDFVVVGEVGLQLVGDWYLGDTRLISVPLSDPDLGPALDEVNVTAPYGRMFVNGHHVYLVSSDWQTGRTSVTVVDVQDPRDLRITGEMLLPEQVTYWGYGYYGGWWGGDELVQVGGDTLVFHAYRYWYRDYDRAEGQGDEAYDRLYMVDLSDPARPVLASTVTLREGDWVYGLKASGDTLYFTHYEWLGTDDQGRGEVRYYLDRYDLSDPAAPVQAAKVNVPGFVVELSADGRLAYTLDYTWREGWQTYQTFNALRVGDGVAELLDRVDLPGWIGNLAVDGNAAFATTQDQLETSPGVWESRSELISIDLSNASSLRIAGRERLPEAWGWLREVEGDRAFVDLGWMGGLLVYDVSDLEDLELETFHRHQGWINAIQVAQRKAWLAMGYYGVQVIPLDD